MTIRKEILNYKEEETTKLLIANYVLGVAYPITTDVCILDCWHLVSSPIFVADFLSKDEVMESYCLACKISL